MILTRPNKNIGKTDHSTKDIEVKLEAPQVSDSFELQNVEESLPLRQAYILQIHYRYCALLQSN